MVKGCRQALLNHTTSFTSRSFLSSPSSKPFLSLSKLSSSHSSLQTLGSVSSPLSTMSTPPQLRSFQPRQKRQQVSRACDSCRSQRIKCDTDIPCSQCRIKGNECSKITNHSVSSLSQARSEIDRLQKEVRDLRKRLQANDENPKALHNGRYRVADLTPSENVGALPVPGDKQSEKTARHDTAAFWPGVQLASGRQPQNRSWHGPSSLTFFMSRIAEFLSTGLHRQHSTEDSIVRGRTGTLLSKSNTSGGPSNTAQHSAAKGLTSDLQVFGTETPLSPTQEDYFLNLYWTSIHADSYPILDEKEFKDHYRSLWRHGGNSRAPSALVDIVLALCMQAAFPRGAAEAQPALGDGDLDAGVAGRWYYRRCQSSLVDEMESPTLATLQCHILSSMYLCSGSFHNMSDTACSLAVRTAYTLGMHLDPSNFDFSPKEQEHRRRLWWATYVADCKIGLKLGRPFLLPSALQNQGSPSLLSDTMEAASDSGSFYAPLGDGKTWLSFHLHVTKLYALAKSALQAFYNIQLPPDVSSGFALWNNEKALQFHANLLFPYLECLEKWTTEVPEILHLRQACGVDGFSTAKAALSVENFAPVWLQRQRLTLALMYHHLHTCLCRSFIRFPTLIGSVPGESSAHVNADNLALRCAEHATKLVRIYHEAISTTSLLSGRNEPFQWLWSAAITLVGFLLAHQFRSPKRNPHRQNRSATVSEEDEMPSPGRRYTGDATPSPVHDTISNARDAVVLAAGVFDILGESLGETPVQAAKVVRSLLSELDAIATSNGPETNGSSSNSSCGPVRSMGNLSDLDNSLLAQAFSDSDDLLWADLAATQEWLATTQDLFESAFQVDESSGGINFSDTNGTSALLF